MTCNQEGLDKVLIAIGNEAGNAATAARRSPNLNVKGS